MNKLILALALAFSSTAFAAAPKGPEGTGNFRRAEALKAAGASGAKYAYVASLKTAHEHVSAPKNPANARVLFVVNAGKVTPVKAPVDKTQKVKTMSAAQMHEMGLLTQADAMKTAKSNGKGLEISPAGMSVRDGSYRFKEKAASGKARNYYVTVSGSGMSASIGKKALENTKTPGKK